MRATDKQRGFTLLEIMVVIVIIGVLASLVVPNLMGNKEKADKQKAVSDIVALENALDMYKLDNHHYVSPSNWRIIIKMLPSIY
jgi:general secretion pathway protein G